KPRGLPGALSGPVRGPTGRAGCERPYIGEDFSVPAERPGRAGRGGGCGVGRATTNGGRPERGGRRRVRPENRCYFRVTVAPAPSRAALALSAVSLLTPSSSGFGALSTRSLASLRPRLVRPRTSLMTWIFLSPAASRTTSNSSFSSSAGAAPPPAPGAAATTAAAGAAASTSNFSSN